MLRRIAKILKGNPATAFLYGLTFTAVLSSPALANSSIDDIAGNMVGTVNQLPALLSALCYLVALVLGVTAIFKIKDHVENPSQTPLRTGLIRFLAGGALLALPMIAGVVNNAITGGGTSTISFDNESIATQVAGFMGTLSGLIPTMNINNILMNIRDSLDRIPALISAVAYLLGILLCATGVLKVKDHVESPEQTPMKEGVIRLLTAGALFALPSIYNSMFNLIASGGLSGTNNAGSFFGSAGLIFSGYGRSGCNPLNATVSSTGSLINSGLGAIGINTGVSFSGTSMGNVVCSLIYTTGVFPMFLTACAYLIGLIFGLWGILKIKAHVQNPQQTSLWEGVSRFISGGAFFALPVVIEIVRGTMTPTALTAPSLAVPVTGYNTGSASSGLSGLAQGSGTGVLGTIGNVLGNLGTAVLGSFGINTGNGNGCGSGGLDVLLRCFMSDMMSPIHIVLNFFCFCTGIILLMIGISRLIKTAQDGARGPGGLGTLMTFAAGGALISYNEMMRALTSSFFGVPLTQTFATMRYTTGMQAAEIASAHATISAILQFVIIVGLISFVRGIFIIRGVAEGNSQASIMSGITHIVAGALAVNLGPLMNAVQTTLGLTSVGITFS